MNAMVGYLKQARGQRHTLLGVIFHVGIEGRSYLNLLYLVLTFPLGLGYFLVLTIGLSVGAGTALVIIGIPILLLTCLIWWGCAAFERELAIWWLHASIRPMALPPAPGLSLWGRLRERLRNPVTWKSLVYLFAKFPLGIASFFVAFTLITLAAGLTLSPFAYPITVYSHQMLGVTTPSYALSPFGVVAEDGTFQIDTLAKLLPMSLLGIIIGVLTLHLCNGMAWLWGEFARVMLGISDLSARLAEARAVAVQERAKAQRSDQSRRELIVNVGHELRTPIASIRGHVESLLMSTEDAPGATLAPATMQAYLGIVNREAERLGSLVDDLLALARADADELRLDIAPIAAGAVVDEVWQTLAPLAQRERKVTVVREVATDVPDVMADRQRLLQVLLNLARNAITYTPDGGIVSLTLARADNTWVALEVADTGIGIPPADLGRVFDRFYRTDASRARSSGGFGLGLAIVRDLVQAMGGTVSATSTENEGSRFVVMLRVAPLLATGEQLQGK